MSIFKKLIKSLLVVLTCFLVLFSVGTQSVKATDGDDPYVPPPSTPVETYKPKFTLVYPDGSTKVFDSYEKAEKELDKEVLLYKSDKAITDENGQIILKDWMKEGNIRIVEIEAPIGYEIITKEKEVDLKEGNTTFVNKEKPKKETPKPETPRPVSIPKTAVKHNGIYELLTRIIDILKPYNVPDIDIPDVPEVNILPPIDYKNVQELGVQYEKGNFIINKVDEEGKPLKGAKFEVYGKPKLYVSVLIAKLYEQVQETHIDEGPDSDDHAYLPSPLNLIKSIFVKSINADEPTGPVTYYLETNITISIDGVGSGVVTPDKPNLEFNLEVGKTYSVSEVINLEAKFLENYSFQSYLNEYKIIVSEDGKVTSDGQPSKWNWLIAETETPCSRTIIYKVISLEELIEIVRTEYFEHRVILSGNVLVIRNHAGILPPPKCNEPCPLDEPCQPPPVVCPPKCPEPCPPPKEDNLGPCDVVPQP